MSINQSDQRIPCQRYRRMHPRVAPLLALALSCAFAGASQATVVQFDQIRDGTGTVVPTINGNPPETDYADRVTGSPMDVPGGQFTYGNDGEGFTPNVVADFFASNAIPGVPNVGLWGTQYGDLTNVLFGSNASVSLNVRLTADPGFAVQLYHFDLAGWPNADYTINAVTVLDGLDVLFTQTGVLVEGDGTGPGHTAFDFLTPLTGTDLLIQIDYANLAEGARDNIGIDNIRFGQTPPALIPLPGAMLLFASGFAWMGTLGYRRPRLR